MRFVCERNGWSIGRKPGMAVTSERAGVVREFVDRFLVFFEDDPQNNTTTRTRRTRVHLYLLEVIFWRNPTRLI